MTKPIDHAPTTEGQITRARRYALLVLITVLGLLYIGFIATTANHAIIESHSFRQTQTAISTYYLIEDGLTFNYITPVFGTPWTIPFEAPIYQISVALFAKISPLGLDANGRIVSALYWLGCLILGYRILWYLFPARKTTARIFIILALCSPLYIFWSRTFMIETTALFFGLGFLYALMRFTDKGGWIAAITATLLGVLCVLTKATTWPVFVVAGGIYYLLQNKAVITALRPATLTTADTITTIKRGAVLLIAVLIALYIGLSWTTHTDVLKKQSMVGFFLASDNLSLWNFGDMSTRFTKEFWIDLIKDRAIPEAIGQFWWVAVFLFIALLALRNRASHWRKTLTLTFTSILLFLLPMVLFANLHIQHEYYQAANSIFLIAAVASVIGALLEAGKHFKIIGSLGLVAVVAGQIITFTDGYYKLTTNPSEFTDQPPHQIALLVKERVSTHGTLMTLGLDWSSHVFYYGQRKGMAVPLWIEQGYIKMIMDRPSRVLGEKPLAGIVDCIYKEHSKDYPIEQALMDQFIEDSITDPKTRWDRVEAGYCTLHYRIDL
ncbi:ArnT family glycosyltransferase [Fretibacter rubidus]|uniref:ArnT family glycosyltransferase n=1 Tax=Fretibacter rubidus TaxID=570162 RepID=UPI00352AB7F1